MTGLKIKWTYILLGDDAVGKTTFQKLLVQFLANHDRPYDRLPSNKIYDINHPRFCKSTKIFIIGRSIQEFANKPSVEKYFDNSFQDADICILASHISDNGGCTDTIQQMIDQCHRRKYNVAFVFFTNADNQLNQDISLLNWDLRINFLNPTTQDQNQQMAQLRYLTFDFIEHIKA